MRVFAMDWFLADNVSHMHSSMLLTIIWASCISVTPFHMWLLLCWTIVCLIYFHITIQYHLYIIWASIIFSIGLLNTGCKQLQVLAHLSRRVKWAIANCFCPSSVVLLTFYIFIFSRTSGYFWKLDDIKLNLVQLYVRPCKSSIP